MAPASALLVATPDIRRRLEARGFTNLAMWSRGVDTDLFHAADRRSTELARPIFAYIGRVAVEKNIEAFLELDLPGSKWGGGRRSWRAPRSSGATRRAGSSG